MQISGLVFIISTLSRNPNDPFTGPPGLVFFLSDRSNVSNVSVFLKDCYLVYLESGSLVVLPQLLPQCFKFGFILSF